MVFTDVESRIIVRVGPELKISYPGVHVFWKLPNVEIALPLAKYEAIARELFDDANAYFPYPVSFDSMQQHFKTDFAVAPLVFHYSDQ